MKYLRDLLTLLAILCSTAGVVAESAPTAVRGLQLSAFAMATGVYTGLSGGRNLSFTAGGDLGLRPWLWMRPTLEVRGTYHLDSGHIVAQKSALGGVNVEFLLDHRLRPYADFLFGRGQMNYQAHDGQGGYLFGGGVYSLSTAYIASPGAGFDYQFTHHLGVKLDGQVERWSFAPTPSGVLYSKVLSAGIVYYFTFDRRYRH